MATVCAFRTEPLVVDGVPVRYAPIGPEFGSLNVWTPPLARNGEPEIDGTTSE